MTGQAFSLVPFPAPNIPAMHITGNIALQNHVLVLNYLLGGNIAEVLLPPVSPNPGRQDELWKATCLELFLAIKDQPGYWEFNLSPSGDWNVYRMDTYRRLGFREERGISQLTFETKEESNGYSLHVPVDLSSIIRPEADFQMAITAIVQTKDGNETFWALMHHGATPDFHLRESFILALAGQTHPLAQSGPDG